MPIEEFKSLLEMAESYEDLKDLRQAKADTRHEEGIPLADGIAELAPELKR